MMRRGVVVVAAVVALAAPAASHAAPVKQVNAEGNPFSGGLAFDPANVTVSVGQVVRWTNTDDVVPHTATENHGLWDLTGDYGIPGAATGFGPGESRERPFEAGTQRYYCKVHPNDMQGVVAVPVTLARKRFAGGRKIVMTWAPAAPASGLVFDVQMQRAGGAWKTFRTGTREAGGVRKRHGAKLVWSVRARLRRASDATAATGWSPVATIKA
jgi:plastocyanin